MCDDAGEKVKEATVARENAEKRESQIREKRGLPERSVRDRIEHEIFPEFNVKFSSYHGRNMEGPSIRTNMMANGIPLFEKISELVKTTRDNTTHSTITDKEIEEHCSAFGCLAVLLDGIFLKLNTKRGCVSDLVISELENHLELARVEWDRVGLSQTPKWHLLLDHIVWLLKQTRGFADMGEDAIERFHQIRVRDETRLIRLRNETIIKNTQAKMQHTRMIGEVQRIKELVNGQSKRKRKPDQQTLGEKR